MLLRKRTNVRDTGKDEVKPPANLDFHIYPIAQVLALTFCLRCRREPGCSACWDTGNHSPVSNLPSILQWCSAINTPQVGSCHDALALKGADSVTAGKLRAPCGPAPATCSGRSHLCQDPGWRGASGIPGCPLPSVDSRLQGSLSSKSRTDTFANHLPAPIWWPFKNPSLSQRNPRIIHSSKAVLTGPTASTQPTDGD